MFENPLRMGQVRVYQIGQLFTLRLEAQKIGLREVGEWKKRGASCHLRHELFRLNTFDWGDSQGFNIESSPAQTPVGRETNFNDSRHHIKGPGQSLPKPHRRCHHMT